MTPPNQKESSKPPKSPPDRRVSTPTILQMEAVECGAAALAIVLAAHGRWVPLEELRLECGVSRDGSKASNVLRAARKYGLIAKGFKYELEDLYGIEYPAILFWNFNHFLVLEGFHRGKAYLNDPAMGPRTVSLEELDSSFSGVTLTLTPGTEFRSGGEKRSLIPAIRRRLQTSRNPLTFIVLCGLFLVVPGLVIPTFSRIFIDEFLIGGREALIRPLLFGMALTALLRMGLTWLQEHYLLRMETKLALTTSIHFFEHVLRLPMSYFSQRFAGEIGSRVHINNSVAQLLSGELATTLLDCVLVVFYAALMFLYDGTLTALCIAIALLNIVAVKYVSRRRTDVSRRLLQEEGKLTGTAMNGLMIIETLKASGSESEFFSRWAGYQAKALRAKQELGVLTEFVSAVPPLVSALTTTLILLIGSLKIMNGELTVGMLVAYQSLMASFRRPLNTFVGFGARLQELEADMNRLDDLLSHPQDGQYSRDGDGADSPGSGVLENVVKLSGRVEFRDVSFGYSPLEDPLIEEFNLAIEPGQRVALVGRSGSGKSTVARLLTGLYQPWEGEILLDGVPIKELPITLVRNSLAAVDQDIFLFKGTVRENVAMWDSTVSATKITGSCRDAAIDDVIQTRPDTYESAVAEAGRNFSGGQRQRLEIARSLVGDPSILVLDEATSALDPTTERIIDENLRRRGCTCIIVAHRLSTIRDCDEIVVLDRGRIVQRGTHEEMKSAEGPYAELIRE
jgi:NHLM bacteriocin system ABC transporter peptidase/ATP-binding protein